MALVDRQLLSWRKELYRSVRSLRRDVDVLSPVRVLSIRRTNSTFQRINYGHPGISDRTDIVQLTPNVARILTRPAASNSFRKIPTNTFLLGTPTSPYRLLIDPGPTPYDSLLHIIRAVCATQAAHAGQGRTVRVAGIAVTHGHGGHVDWRSLKWLAGELQLEGRVDVIASELAKEGAGIVSKFVGSSAMDLSFGGEDMDVTVAIRALPTPGHTADSVSYFHQQSGSLFVGDAVFAVPVKVSEEPPDMIHMAPARKSPRSTTGDVTTSNLTGLEASYESLPDYLSSLSSITQTFPKHIFPGHGAPVLSPLDVSIFLDRASEVQDTLSATISRALKGVGVGQKNDRRARADGEPPIVATAKHVELVSQTLKIPTAQQTTFEQSFIRGTIIQHVLELEKRGGVIRHVQPGGESADASTSQTFTSSKGERIDPTKIYGPGGLNMVEVMGLLKDRQKKDELHYGNKVDTKAVADRKAYQQASSGGLTGTKYLHPCHKNLEWLDDEVGWEVSQ